MEGICPECEFDFTVPELESGETIVCRECQLTLQVRGVEGERLVLEPVEASLADWGQ